jgi:hypothetical protein
MLVANITPTADPEGSATAAPDDTWGTGAAIFSRWRTITVSKIPVVDASEGAGEVVIAAKAKKAWPTRRVNSKEITAAIIEQAT